MLLRGRKPSGAARPRGWQLLLAVLGLLLAGGATAGLRAMGEARLEARLLQTLPDEIPRDPQLVRTAVAQARPLYLQHCAVCHGEQLQGNPQRGAPSLRDAIWLYGRGTVFEIERTLLYGIRSASSKGHNVTDMPPLGLTGLLSPGEVREMVQLVLELSGKPHDGEAALAGRQRYMAQCADCHGGDARGNDDYGAPDLTTGIFNSGADPDSLYRSIYYGRHGVMPGWLGTLSLGQIRALAVYVHAVSHPHAATPGPNAGDRRAEP